MGLRGQAAIVGYVELPPERMNKATPAPFAIEQWAELSAAALARCGTAGRRRQRHRGLAPGRVGDLRTLDDR